MNQNIENIKNILQQFAREEIGNRLSNFSMTALRSAIEYELNQIETPIDRKKEEGECPP